MIRPSLTSITLSSIWAIATLPTQAQAISEHEPPAAVWSSHDGIVRSGRTPQPDPEVETMPGLSRQPADREPSQSRDALICEPFK